VIRLLLDTNVLVAATAYPSSAVSKLVGLASDGEAEVIVTDLLLREVHGAFEDEFGRGAGRDGYRLLARMPAKRVLFEFEWAHLEAEVKALVRDRSDVPRVCAFLEGRGDLFVTLDKKLRQMPIRHRVQFVSPEEALTRMRGPMG